MKTYAKHFAFHTDPGHGWLEVDWTDLKAVDLNPTDFSRCSYRRGNTFYLEEDCDAPKFAAAFEAKYHKPIAHHEVYVHNTFIRNLPRIHDELSPTLALRYRGLLEE